VTLNGSIRNAFIKYDSAIYVGGPDPGFNFTKYDHAVLHQTGGWNEYFTLPWTLHHSGRRLCLLNYRWGSSISTGVCDISAPSGKYFYEDGISKTRLTLSHEVVELMGYGDTTTFFGWIVLNRIDLMTTSRYGKKLNCLAEGVVTVSGSSLSYRTRTFEGNSFSVTRSGTGLYYVYLPWSLGATKYYVMATGRWGSANNTPIYPTIKYQYDSYFCIQTQDDPSANDGSFNFQVFSIADWDL